MAKFTLTEEQFNAERASGKSIAKIAKEQGVSEATIYNHVSKWTDARKPGQEKLLREKNVSPPGPPSAELLNKAEKEIERLTTENQQLQDKLKSSEEERVELVNEVTQFKIDIDWIEGEKQKEINRLDQRMVSAQNQATKAWAEVEQLRDKNDQYAATINEMREDRVSLVAENTHLADRIYELKEQLEQQQTVNAVPDTEVQRLDTAIQDLTRARWILNRLSASGE